MLLIVYLEKKIESLTRTLDKIEKKYGQALKRIDNSTSGLEGIDPLKGKLKVFYSTIVRRYITVINTYLNRGNSNIDLTERSQIKILLKIVIGLASSIEKQISQYIKIGDNQDADIIKKQKLIRENVILKTYFLFKIIEKINNYFGSNEIQYKKFINYVYLKIFDLFERESEIKKIYKNDEKYFRNFPEVITGLRPHKALQEIVISNKKTEKEDKKLKQLVTLYLNHVRDFIFLVIPISDSQFYINNPTIFDFTIQKQQNEYEVISTELFNLTEKDYKNIVRDFDSKNPILPSMFTINVKGKNKTDLKGINSITNVKIQILGSFSLNNIEKQKNKKIDLKSYFSKNNIGEIEIE
jgi:NACalpha-BTF3-like transcription factor